MTSRNDATRYDFTADDDVAIAAYRWDPDGVPRGVVQLTHGMGEHLLRYGELAGSLTAQGYVVVGQDHRGHGASVAADAELGQLGASGWRGLVEDIGALSRQVRRDIGRLPLVLLGHSMGSIAAQQYTLEHSADIDALVLTGTAAIDLLEPALDLDTPLDLAMFNAPFAPARTDYDWLSRDDAQVDAYLADPRCGFGIDVEAAKAMFAGARPLAVPDRLALIRNDLPIYVAVGEQDPVNGQLVLVHALVDRLRGAGLTDVTLTIYPEARHEVFNETNRVEVIDDLIAWLNRIVPRT